jgi:Ca2+-binding RTX toxin-like protein
MMAFNFKLTLALPSPTGEPFGTSSLYYGRPGDDRVNASGSDNIIKLSRGNDTVYGLGGRDFLYGEGDNDSIYGGSGNDYLHGGAGNDLIDGGSGSADVAYFYEGYASKKITVNLTKKGNQKTGLGTDKIKNVEHVVGGIKADKLTGDKKDNTLIGNAGSDKLDGKAGNDVLSGGLGRDKLIGGTGRDSFVFDTKAAANNIDTVTDFNVGEDKIYLKAGKTAFAGLAKGYLAEGAFVVGAVALEADDRIIYDNASGLLSFDADGNGVAAQVGIAFIGANLAPPSPVITDPLLPPPVEPVRFNNLDIIVF